MNIVVSRSIYSMYLFKIENNQLDNIKISCRKNINNVRILMRITDFNLLKLCHKIKHFGSQNWKNEKLD